MGWNSFKSSFSQHQGTPGLIANIAMGGSPYVYGQMTGANRANDIAEENYREQQANYAYQRWLQQQIFEREDSAVQRRAKDLLLAGQSPILAAGSGAGAGAIVPTTVPQKAYNRVDMSEAGKMVWSILSMLPDISKTVMESEAIDSQVMGSRLDNIVKAVDAENSLNSGIGKHGGMVGDAIKSLTGAGHKIYKDVSGVIEGAIKPLQKKLEVVMPDNKFLQQKVNDYYKRRK